jgi:secondary thiamine-phosphate synthase enzyme
MVISKTIHINTKGNCDVIDITSQISNEISQSVINNGIITIFISGSTAGISTIEYEEGVIDDFKIMWDRNIPKNITYRHDSKWGDGNGFSHVRASLLGASLVVPFSNKKLLLGTWQQIIVMDFDNRPRSREIVLQLIGE